MLPFILFVGLASIVFLGIRGPGSRFFQRRLQKKLMPKLSRTRLDFRTEIEGWKHRVNWASEADVPVGTRAFRFPPLGLNVDDPTIMRCTERVEVALHETRKEHEAFGARDSFFIRRLSVDVEGVRAEFNGEKELATRNIARWSEVLDQVVWLLAPRAAQALESLTCARCQVPLVVQKSALAEHICEICAGVFLPSESAQTFISELQTDVASLKDFADGADRGIACSACQSAMKRVFLDDNTIAELCTHCGAMWLDKGELKSLSLGKYGEAATMN